MSKKTRDKYSKLEKIYLGAPLSPSERKTKGRLLRRPVKAIDPAKIKTVAGLVDAFKDMSVQARRVGQCAEVYENMLSDRRRPTVILGLAGPLIAGGLREVIRSMVEYGIVDVIVSTGAIIYQDIFQARGYRHYKGTPEADDASLRDLLINRIYDSYVDDEKFVETDTWISRFADRLEPGPYSSRKFLELLGREVEDDRSILRTAVRRGVPVFCPALNDSSIGIGLTDHYHLSRRAGKPHLIIDSIRDNYELTQIVVKSRGTSAVYVAGGVPKNYINDSVVMGYIFGKITGGHTHAFQLTTDVPHWGGLSGSTLGEATSWGKVSRKATRAMAFVEPTVSLPLVVGAVIQKGLWRGRRRFAMKWDGDILKELKPGALVRPKKK